MAVGSSVDDVSTGAGVAAPSGSSGATDRHRNPLVRLYRGDTSFDFMGRRRYWFALSGTIIIAGLISLGIHGLNLGIDFKGGTSWEVKAPKATVAKVQSAVQKDGVSGAIVQKLGGTFISVQADLSRMSSARQSAAKTAVTDTLATMGHTNAGQVSVDDVGPTWGSSVTDRAIEAMIVFFVLVSIVITFVFEWRMAVAAIGKVVLHDLVITVGIFSLTNFQVTSAGVIAVLTIMGYSLYDTVVVFDKINENTKRFSGKRYTYAEVVNLSLNQVLARSLNTTMVAVLPVLSVLIIGAQVLGATTLQQFGFPLVIGLIAGAYSSIFIAAPNPKKMKVRDVQILSTRKRDQEVLTPRAAAAILAGAMGATAGTATRRTAASRAAAAGRGGVITPGSARQVRERPAPVVEEGADGGEIEESEEIGRGNGRESVEVAAVASGPGTSRVRSAPATRTPARPRKRKRRR